MPKDPKKFINPLLRPTIQSEGSHQAVPKEQPSATPRKTPTKTSTSTKTENVTVHVDEEEDENVISSNATNERPAVPDIAAEAAPLTSEEQVNISGREKLREIARPRLASSRIKSDESQEAPIKHVRPLEEAASSSEQQPDPVREHATAPLTLSSEHATYIPTTLKTYTSSVDVSSPSQGGHTPEVDPARTMPSALARADSATSIRARLDEEDPFSDLRPVRRKRGAQAFERTHERITLWIDKRLKQGFEELAYQQELSKTSLLNEAIADLLRKHGLL